MIEIEFKPCGCKVVTSHHLAAPGRCPICVEAQRADAYKDELQRTALKLGSLRAALRWAYDRLDVDDGMTYNEQRRTVEELGKVLAGEDSWAADYAPDPHQASIRRESGQWPT